MSDNWRVSRNLSIEAGVRYTWHQPIYTAANNMASFDPGALRPGARGDREPQRHAGARLRRPLQRHGPRGRRRPARRSCSACPTATTRPCSPCPPARPRGFYPNRSTCSRRASASPGRRPSSGDMAVRGGVGLFYDRPEGNLLFGGGGNGPVNSPPYVAQLAVRERQPRRPRRRRACPRSAPLGTLAAIDPDLQGSARLELEPERAARAAAGASSARSATSAARARTCCGSPTSTSRRSRTSEPTRRCPRRSAPTRTSCGPYKGYSQHPDAAARTPTRATTRCSSSSASGGAAALDGQLHARAAPTTTRAATATTPRTTRTRTSTGDRATSTARTSSSAPGPGRSRSSASRRASAGVLGGWELSGIGRYQSGAPLTVTANTTIGAPPRRPGGRSVPARVGATSLPIGAVPLPEPGGVRGRAGRPARQQRARRVPRTRACTSSTSRCARASR